MHKEVKGLGVRHAHARVALKPVADLVDVLRHRQRDALGISTALAHSRLRQG